MKIVCFFFAFSIILWPSHAIAQCDSLRSLHWLLENWIAEDAVRFTEETWTQVSPHTFEGSGAIINKSSNERHISERLRIVEMSGEIFYIAKPIQNEFPTAFKLTQCSEGTVVFENTSHEFPKLLKYDRVGNDSLVVHVSDGESNGFSLHFMVKDDG